MKLSKLNWNTSYSPKSAFSKANAKAKILSGYELETEILYNNDKVIDYGTPQLIEPDFSVKASGSIVTVPKHFQLALNYTSLDFMTIVSKHHQIGLRFEDGLDAYSCEGVLVSYLVDRLGRVDKEERLICEVGFIEFVLDLNLKSYTNNFFGSFHSDSGKVYESSKKNCLLLDSVNLKHLCVSINFQLLDRSLQKVEHFGRKYFNLTDKILPKNIQVDGSSFLSEIQRASIDFSEMNMSIEL